MRVFSIIRFALSLISTLLTDGPASPMYQALIETVGMFVGKLTIVTAPPFFDPLLPLLLFLLILTVPLSLSLD